MASLIFHTEFKMWYTDGYNFFFHVPNFDLLQMLVLVKNTYNSSWAFMADVTQNSIHTVVGLKQCKDI